MGSFQRRKERQGVEGAHTKHWWACYCGINGCCVDHSMSNQPGI